MISERTHLRWMSWDDYEHHVAEIAQHVRALAIPTDAVVGIARAGLPLLTSIAALFAVRDVAVIFSRHTLTDEPFSPFLPDAEISGCGIPFSPGGKRLLLVDNVLHSGRTAAIASQLLKAAGAAEVYLLALGRYRDQYPFQYFAPLKLEEGEWVIWPWDRARFIEQNG